MNPYQPIHRMKVPRAWSTVEWPGSWTAGGMDGVVALWDVSKAGSQSGHPLCVSRAQDLHSAGVFSMHAFGDRMLTGSKDFTVASTPLTPTGIAPTPERTFDELHEGVVKCVRARCRNVFASTGNDATVKVVDQRVAQGGGVAASIKGAHPRAVNFVEWHAEKEHVLLTAGNDHHVHVWDLRSTAKGKAGRVSVRGIRW